ncbi:unnamed protein product [Amoebophrya sp. A120]|nr:unnamed protein product [Amoebophrya sp. A120]|eukprot:GSA120T00011518001.1
MTVDQEVESNEMGAGRRGQGEDASSSMHVVDQDDFFAELEEMIFQEDETEPEPAKNRVRRASEEVQEPERTSQRRQMGQRFATPGNSSSSSARRSAYADFPPGKLVESSVNNCAPSAGKGKASMRTSSPKSSKSLHPIAPCLGSATGNKRRREHNQEHELFLRPVPVVDMNTASSSTHEPFWATFEKPTKRQKRASDKVFSPKSEWYLREELRYTHNSGMLISSAAAGTTRSAGEEATYSQDVNKTLIRDGLFHPSLPDLVVARILDYVPWQNLVLRVALLNKRAYALVFTTEELWYNAYKQYFSRMFTRQVMEGDFKGWTQRGVQLLSRRDGVFPCLPPLRQGYLPQREDLCKNSSCWLPDCVAGLWAASSATSSGTHNFNASSQKIDRAVDHRFRTVQAPHQGHGTSETDLARRFTSGKRDGKNLVGLSSTAASASPAKVATTSSNSHQEEKRNNEPRPEQKKRTLLPFWFLFFRHLYLTKEVERVSSQAEDWKDFSTLMRTVVAAEEGENLRGDHSVSGAATGNKRAPRTIADLLDADAIIEDFQQQVVKNRTNRLVMCTNNEKTANGNGATSSGSPGRTTETVTSTAPAVKVERGQLEVKHDRKRSLEQELPDEGKSKKTNSMSPSPAGASVFPPFGDGVYGLSLHAKGSSAHQIPPAVSAEPTVSVVQPKDLNVPTSSSRAGQHAVSAPPPPLHKTRAKEVSQSRAQKLKLHTLPDEFWCQAVPLDNVGRDDEGSAQGKTVSQTTKSELGPTRVVTVDRTTTRRWHVWQSLWHGPWPRTDKRKTRILGCVECGFVHRCRENELCEFTVEADSHTHVCAVSGEVKSRRLVAERPANNEDAYYVDDEYQVPQEMFPRIAAYNPNSQRHQQEQQRGEQLGAGLREDDVLVVEDEEEEEAVESRLDRKRVATRTHIHAGGVREHLVYSTRHDRNDLCLLEGDDVDEEMNLL